jgi:hypothetical protein
MTHVPPVASWTARIAKIATRGTLINRLGIPSRPGSSAVTSEPLAPSSRRGKGDATASPLDVVEPDPDASPDDPGPVAIGPAPAAGD